METIILWAGFIGAWLLFAGPIYQAALELKDEDIEIDRIKATRANISQPKPVSVWWWLLPPIKIVLERRRANMYRRTYVESLLPEDLEALLSFMNKASAWLFVALGGFFIALKETYELSEHSHWGDFVFIAVVVGLVFLSIFNVINRVKRTQTIIEALQQK